MKDSKTKVEESTRLVFTGSGRVPRTDTPVYMSQRGGGGRGGLRSAIFYFSAIIPGTLCCVYESPVSCSKSPFGAIIMFFFSVRGFNHTNNQQNRTCSQVQSSKRIQSRSPAVGTSK
jgi:hypothetical protein